MSRFRGRTIIMLCVLVAEGMVFAQKAPPVPEHPWDASSAKQPFKAPPRLFPAPVLDPAKIYTLSELVIVAEQNNPDPRVAWENAKARAADLGIAQSTLYPTLAAVALAGSTRLDIFFGSAFRRQTVETFSPVFVLDYIIFDLQRSQEISINRSTLLAANFQFNDTYRKIIFQVMQAYYRLLDSKGQEDAAEANLKNAQTVQQAAEARLQTRKAERCAYFLLDTADDFIDGQEWQSTLPLAGGNERPRKTHSWHSIIMKAWLTSIVLQQRVLLTSILVLLLIAADGCRPEITKFNVAIPGTPPAPEGSQNTQGTTHVCAGSSLQLSWAAMGHVSLSATEGPRYQPPACLAESSVPSQGTRNLTTTPSGGIGTCTDTVMFRITASHDFWRPFGPCPGHGCPNADREIVVSSALDVPVGNRTGDCASGSYEVGDHIPSTNWDNSYEVNAVTLEGSPVANALKVSPGRTFTVIHDGRQAVFQTTSGSSDVFRGAKITGDWTLRLSGCEAPPPALTITVKVSCTK